ncbi:hypothetical protein GCM10010399_80950 [Dactylosporangium fulvum]|uniref:Uncharacterized protein n=1 Tax=Dactylosporangium fulvum TaxID=53359 RepID=A0ABY5VVG4_9ACTN|nr:hypothetical protein [Dactylosporangium fulvum]UWP81170.1 hypothetical protein Dfulv_39595 [Dactylosporangium fulvum]
MLLLLCYLMPVDLAGILESATAVLKFAGALLTNVAERLIPSGKCARTMRLPWLRRTIGVPYRSFRIEEYLHLTNADRS